MDAPLSADNESLFALPLSPRERKVAARHDPLAPLFDDEPNFKRRWIQTLKGLQELSHALRERGYRIVMTSGSFDLLHLGHSIYLQAARAYGDFLIVGVDSDAKIQERKGPTKPHIPQDERLKMLAYQRAVGAVFLKEPSHKRWAMIKYIRPDVLVVTAETYTPDEVAELKKRFKCEVQVLPRMAMLSTSGRLRLLQLGETEGKGDEPFDIFVEGGRG